MVLRTKKLHVQIVRDNVTENLSGILDSKNLYNNNLRNKTPRIRFSYNEERDPILFPLSPVFLNSVFEILCFQMCVVVCLSILYFFLLWVPIFDILCKLLLLTVL